MRVLVYRYNSIFEPDCIETFKEFGLDVVEEKAEMTDKKIPHSKIVEMVAEYILKARDEGDPYLFVFSINFFPAISDVCEKLNTIYACWSVDCPVPELYSKSIKNSCNRVFLFDYTQYEEVSRFNPEGVFYMPLGTNPERMGKVIENITDDDRKKYAADISFVGSLYSEKNPLKNIKLSDYARGHVDGVIAAQMEVYGVNFIEQSLNDRVVEEIIGHKITGEHELMVKPMEYYNAAHMNIGYEIAEKERIRTLNRLAENHNVSLYTLSDTTPLKGVKNCGQAKTLTEMPKIFNLSKINLNITMRPIQTGLPLRIFDILGCGGFLITNYQAEIPSLFEPGVDLETYSSIEELEDKCDYYLTHDEERAQIARNGYEKTVQYHTVKHRVKDMIECMLK
ncbi:MAG: DUF3880 domain-containing protein [Lachnospiraceae bacterium]|nr:DUF3880 domain-containing protein [Lachnospiraceae bacterium]